MVDRSGRCWHRWGESLVDGAMLRKKQIPYPSLGTSCPSPQTKGTIAAVCTLLIAANGLAWIWALREFADQPTLLGAAILAYTFGLRHAVDGDHIAAIDHATRKMPQTAERALAGSLFFTMGHSMVVVVGMLSVTAAAIALSSRSQQFKAVSAFVATGTSTIVLLGIAIVNLAIFAHVWAKFIQVYRRDPVNQPGTGVSCQFRAPMYHHLMQKFDVDPLQFIFRLSMGGVAEIMVLGTLSAQAAERGSMLSWLVLPALFTAPLVLIDITDGMPIAYACAQALSNPLRRIWFCVAVTVVSALVAFFIFGDGIVGFIPEIRRYAGPWLAIGEFNRWLPAIDYVALCFFVLSLVISAQVCRSEYRCQRE